MAQKFYEEVFFEFSPTQPNHAVTKKDVDNIYIQMPPGMPPSWMEGNTEQTVTHNFNIEYGRESEIEVKFYEPVNDNYSNRIENHFELKYFYPDSFQVYTPNQAAFEAFMRSKIIVIDRSKMAATISTPS
jgi:hypothetical protein